MILGEDGTTPVPLYGPGIPVTKNMPTSEELLANDELFQFAITAGNLFDTNECATKRQQVLDRLQSMLEKWAIEVGQAKSVPEKDLERGGNIQIVVFGSTKLQVNNVDSDIDTLCVAPQFVTRQDFFTSFCEYLSRSEGVESLLAIPDAYTPVLKFLINAHSVDMVFASLQLPLTFPMDLLEQRYLHALDEQSVRSLNGVRVAEWICKLVPNMEPYRMALRVIKYWAKQRGLYSSVLGFLGGVNFAILVAQISRLYVNACPFVLVQKFFSVYAAWNWPTPVMLRPHEDLQFTDSDGRYLPVWNSFSNFKDALHIMPIITPAYPAMNSAYNVSRPQLRCVQTEIMRGHMIFQNHGLRQDFPWNRLFEPSTYEFFRAHPRYIQIDISARNAADQRLWFGWVESRIRYLIIALEKPPEIMCHPTANCFHRRPPSTPSPSSAEEFSSETKNNLRGCSRSSSLGQASHDGEGRETAEFQTPQKAPNIARDSHEAEEEDMFISSFFIGLSFQEGLVRADVSTDITEFSDKVNSWKDRKVGMELNISTFDGRSVPSFVYSTKAEPSNIKSCTPKQPDRQRSGASSQHQFSPPLRLGGAAAAALDGAAYDVMYQRGESSNDDVIELNTTNRVLYPEAPDLSLDSATISYGNQRLQRNYWKTNNRRQQHQFSQQQSQQQRNNANFLHHQHQQPYPLHPQHPHQLPPMPPLPPMHQPQHYHKQQQQQQEYMAMAQPMPMRKPRASSGMDFIESSYLPPTPDELAANALADSGLIMAHVNGLQKGSFVPQMPSPSPMQGYHHITGDHQSLQQQQQQQRNGSHSNQRQHREPHQQHGGNSRSAKPGSSSNSNRTPTERDDGPQAQSRNNNNNHNHNSKNKERGSKWTGGDRDRHHDTASDPETHHSARRRNSPALEGGGGSASNKVLRHSLNANNFNADFPPLGMGGVPMIAVFPAPAQPMTLAARLEAQLQSGGGEGEGYPPLSQPPPPPPQQLQQQQQQQQLSPKRPRKEIGGSNGGGQASRKK